ncbi:MAG: alpha/beta hydrolase [Planctomycetaceae bacterium]|nr:alpha/beta hydrolase [Planctomycetaceae bacterium]
MFSIGHILANIVYTTLYYTAGVPLFIAVVFTLVLHLVERIFFLSSHRRSRNLFSGTPWLPFHCSTQPLNGEEIEFQSHEKITLRGTFLRHKSDIRKGSVLFCHEFNGNQMSISPYVEQLVNGGFDVLTFDFRNHGKSDFDYHTQTTPWITTTDMDDVRAAITYFCSRPETDSQGIGIFGLGKGANIALCAAGTDQRVRSIVLDNPMPENRLFNRNCREILLKSIRQSSRISRKRTALWVSLFFRALLYAVTCPVVSLFYTWRRFILGFWYGCRFVNPSPFLKNVRQPIMIVHGQIDTMTRADQIQAFCDRMTVRPKLWLVSAKDRDCYEKISDDCSRQVARFFAEATL